MFYPNASTQTNFGTGTNQISEVLSKRKQPKREHVVFVLDEDPSSQVYLAGNFNDWQPEPMRYNDAKHCFTKAKRLLAGHYEYKFLVNGCWVVDNQNEEFSYNDQGSMNSVLTID